MFLEIILPEVRLNWSDKKLDLFVIIFPSEMTLLGDIYISPKTLTLESYAENFDSLAES